MTVLSVPQTDHRRCYFAASTYDWVWPICEIRRPMNPRRRRERHTGYAFWYTALESLRSAALKSLRARHIHIHPYPPLS
jgi:hypothetical protein